MCPSNPVNCGVKKPCVFNSTLKDRGSSPLLPLAHWQGTQITLKITESRDAIPQQKPWAIGVAPLLHFLRLCQPLNCLIWTAASAHSCSEKLEDGEADQLCSGYLSLPSLQNCLEQHHCGSQLEPADFIADKHQVQGFLSGLAPTPPHTHIFQHPYNRSSVSTAAASNYLPTQTHGRSIILIFMVILLWYCWYRTDMSPHMNLLSAKPFLPGVSWGAPRQLCWALPPSSWGLGMNSCFQP